MAVVAVDEEGGFGVVASRWYDRPGAFLLDVPDLLASVHLYAYRDADGDSLPDSGTVAVACDDNPVALAGDDVAGLLIELPPLPDVDVAATGTVTCADCRGGVGVVALAIDEWGGATPLAHLSVAAPGPYELTLPIDAGEVELFAYRDADGNGIVDPGTVSVEYEHNPITVADADISGLDIDLGSLPDVTAELSGTIGCGDCVGGVGLVVLSVADGFPVVQIALPVAGPFRVEVPHDVGDVELHAYRDSDGDGFVDAGTESAACAANPVTVATDDIAGLDILLPPLPDVTAELAGTISCGDCAGGVGLVVTTSERLGGELLAHLSLAAPGAYAVSLPHMSGEVTLFAYRDIDGDGVPDPGTDVVACPDNPEVVLEDDIAGLDIDLGVLPPLPVVTLSGEITCDDCDGGVDVVIVAADGSFPLAHLGLAAPGAWSADVPDGFGDVEVFAFRDSDLDGRPDPGALPVASDRNPLTVELADISGIDIDLGSLEEHTVSLSGRVSCDDCAGAVGVAVVGADESDFAGYPIAVIGLDGPGTYAVDLPEEAGDVAVYAFRDADNNGMGDWGTDVAEADASPIAVGLTDVTGIDLDLGSLGGPRVELSGEIRCDDCEGPIVLEAVADDLGGWVIRSRRFAGAGDFALDLPAGLGQVSLYGFRDANGDGRPDFGCESIAYDANPIAVADADINDVIIDVTPCSNPDQPLPELFGPAEPFDGGSGGDDDGCGCGNDCSCGAAGGARTRGGVLLFLFVAALFGLLRRDRSPRKGVER